MTTETTTYSSFIDLINNLRPNIKELSADEVKQLLCNKNYNNFALIDVRETEEWDNGYIFGSIHISKGLIERDIEKYIPDRNTNITLYCRSGQRSLLAAENLLKMGYTNVTSMSGGILAWQEAGYQIIND